jgi:large subunit ribosomal protein L15
MESLLSSLPRIISRKKKRLGRGAGSGKGAKSGKGTTRHQKARETIPLHFEGGQGRMVKRFPLLRGKGKNKSRQPMAFTLTVAVLNSFKDGETVDVPSLRQKGLIGKTGYFRVKVVGGGELKRKLQVKLPVSQSVKAVIEKAGGSVVSA